MHDLKRTDAPLVLYVHGQGGSAREAEHYRPPFRPVVVSERMVFLCHFYASRPRWTRKSWATVSKSQPSTSTA